MICPCCGEGPVREAIVRATGERVCVCDECDTVWTPREPVSDTTGLIFDLFARPRGLEPLWTELELL